MMNPALQAFQAMLNITWDGRNGDLPDPIAYDATDADIRRYAAEAIAAGGVPGIGVTRGADLRDFVVDRFPATAEVPFNRVFLRPKTPFG